MRSGLTSTFLTFFAGSILLSFSHVNAGLSNVGLKGGVSVANQTIEYWDDQNQEFDSRSGVTASVFTDLCITSHLALSPTIGYTQKGSQDADTVTGVFAYERDWRLDYLSVQAMLKAGVEPIGHINIYILAGPRLDFLLESNWDYKIDLSDGGFAPDDPHTDHLKSPVVGAVLGLGLEIPLFSRNSLVVETVYDFDLTAARESDPQPVKITSTRSIKNRSIGLLVGIKFGL